MTKPAPPLQGWINVSFTPFKTPGSTIKAGAGVGAGVGDGAEVAVEIAVALEPGEGVIDGEPQAVRASPQETAVTARMRMVVLWIIF